MAKKFDFSGWATRANMLCADGRVIMKDAFKECDGITVPMVWNHQHNQADQVLGHALLENREDGVYAYGYFNDTESGQNAKLLVQHGDVNRLSIYANRLKQHGSNVIHGVIRELSLVLAGANPGAVIDSVIMHGEDFMEEGYISSGDYLENVEPLFHSDTTEKGDEKVAEETKKPETTEKEETVEDVINSMTEKQKKVFYAMVGMARKEAEKEAKDEAKHSDEEDEDLSHAEEGAAEDEETVEDVFNTLTDKQKKVVHAMIGLALEEGLDDDEEEDDENEGGNNDMKHNVFDKETATQDNILTHDELTAVVEDAKNGTGSLRKAFLAHGIDDIKYLFPDAKNINNVPDFVKREDSWVTEVMNSVKKTPFSRVKSIHADITEDEARAKGYVKGRQKADEVFSLLKRATTPTTVYKMQTIDRDDVVDITEFDVIAWLKTEMRMMLNEEIARAILVGDGRQSSSNDKINEGNIRPIWTDDDVYTVKQEIAATEDMTEDVKAKEFIKACIRSRKNYKGSGNPTMFMSEDMLTECLLLEDKNGRIIYDSVDKLATALRCKKIVTVPVMEGLKRQVATKNHELAGIYVNLMDYNVGADKGGAVNMFDDFDIDFNRQKYLIETRCSGAMVKPYGAVAIEFVSGN